MKQKTCVNIFVHKIKPENLEKKHNVLVVFQSSRKKKKLKNKRIGETIKTAKTVFVPTP